MDHITHLDTRINTQTSELLISCSPSWELAHIHLLQQMSDRWTITLSTLSFSVMVRIKLQPYMTVMHVNCRRRIISRQQSVTVKRNQQCNNICVEAASISLLCCSVSHLRVSRIYRASTQATPQILK